MMWILVANGLAYLTWTWLRDEWRDTAPRRGDARDAWEMVRSYLFRRADHPLQGKHNALQRTTYFALPLLTALIVLSGLAIWKPVSFHWLTVLFGGYVWARWWQFAFLLAVVVLATVHVFMVLTVDPYALRAMTTGGYDESLSPDERNARPFYHLVPRYRDGRDVILRAWMKRSRPNEPT